jgi:micrococcal nuclease
MSPSRCFVAAALLWSAPSFGANTFEAFVTRVVDGDTVWLQTAADAAGKKPKPLKLRLQGIDAPERCQAWGAQAAAALQARVLHQRVQVQTRARDDYQRTLGNLWLNGEDVSAWMVSQGHAWSYHYRRSSGPYGTQEQQAQAARRGLFSDAAAVEPRWFRRSHGPCQALAAGAGAGGGLRGSS